MKIRILANSFRFRLKMPEVQRLQEDRFIEETVDFGIASSDKLSFALKLSDREAYGLSFAEGKIIFYLPAKQADEWITTNLVGISQQLDTGKGKKISLLVEKDFKCMDVCTEDNAGSYQQPIERAH